jgi:hypothetical protein
VNAVRIKGLQKLSALLDLELSYSHAKHNFELGLPLERSLQKFFRPYFPARYGFSSGYIVDDTEQVSNQTDWIIFDTEHFAPLLAQIHGVEGAEWLPFDAVYGCVEVKRSLTEDALKTAIRQIAATKKLTRQKTSLLQVSPYLALPEQMLNVAAGAEFHEACNSLYAGIYAFMPGDYKDSELLYGTLEQYAKEHGVLNLPDFIAVHGRYYIRRATVEKSSGRIEVHPFLERANCYVTVESKHLTAGVFYADVLAQFANMLLSARSNAVAFTSLLKSADLLQVTGKRYIYA